MRPGKAFLSQLWLAEKKNMWLWFGLFLRFSPAAPPQYSAMIHQDPSAEYQDVSQCACSGDHPALCCGEEPRDQDESTIADSARIHSAVRNQERPIGLNPAAAQIFGGEGPSPLTFYR